MNLDSAQSGNDIYIYKWDREGIKYKKFKNIFVVIKSSVFG